MLLTLTLIEGRGGIVVITVASIVVITVTTTVKSIDKEREEVKCFLS